MILGGFVLATSTMALAQALIEVVRIIILLLMLAVAGGSIQLSIALNRLLRPIAQSLTAQHHSLAPAGQLSPKLERCQEHYASLLAKADEVDSAEFSAGWIETLEISFLRRNVTAASAYAWIRQAPSILISLGLLGTFAGLTIGLGQISGVLAANLNPSQAMEALSDLLRPMATAFETSLLGLFLSMVVLIWTQVTGTRSCLQRCETLLSSWLETVLPLRDGQPLMTPLRVALDGLTSSTKDLPSNLSREIRIGMTQAFEHHLGAILKAQTHLGSESISAVESLLRFSNLLNESGQDFIEAAQAFRDSDFANQLSSSVKSLIETREQLISSTATLNTRLFDVRDSLLSNQSDWSLLAKAASSELEANRIARQELQNDVLVLREATNALQLVNESSIEATKQLREARLEVMRDRKLALETAAEIRERLSIDNSTSAGLQAFTDSLSTALSSWSANVEQLNQLSVAFVDSVRNAKLEDESEMLERCRVAGIAISDLRVKLLADIGTAISEQHASLAELATTTTSAKQMATALVDQLEQLRQKIESIPPPPNQPAPRNRWGF